MKKLFTLLTAIFAVFVSSCTYDDTALVEDLNNLRNEVENLKDQVDEQQTLLNALANQLTIISIEATSEGYIITFSDNSTITINHGKDGANGKDGADGKDSSIINIEWDEDSVSFTLSDGTILVIPLESIETAPEIPNNPTVSVEAVDLGLSVKWASCNVGATKPEESGDYFAWGETKTKEEYTEDSSLTFGESMENISGNPQYDAATANWGNNWRIPTKSETDELVDNCTWNWTILNGVNGMEVTGPNGNSIFLPAAGYHGSWSLEFVGSRGVYFSSTPDEDYNDLAYSLYFDNQDYFRGWDHRNTGLSIRPVQDK